MNPYASPVDGNRRPWFSGVPAVVKRFFAVMAICLLLIAAMGFFNLWVVSRSSIGQTDYATESSLGEEVGGLLEDVGLD